MDVVLNKKESIERCINQIKLYYSTQSPLPFEEDYYKQDAIAANLQRACEQSIDVASHIIKKYKLGLPKSTKDCFDILATNNIIPESLSKELKGMVGFRNLLVHQYMEMDINIFKGIIENHLDDLVEFTNICLKYVMEN